ncbi:MAG: efflux RND transporter permease subunit [SAR324 cluster bacterium]|nr:efflux RND transporter permease subunit [SAR324 cluster bacterium]
MKALLKYFVGNSVLANLLMLILLLSGIITASFMVREEMPNVSTDRISINVAYPGADPEEVVEGVIKRIEESISGMEGVAKFSSEAFENGGSTSIEIDRGYDVEFLLDRVRNAVNSISNFPIDSETPVITSSRDSEALMALYMSGSVSEKALKAWAFRVKDDLLALQEVSQVELTGHRKDEISIEVSERKLRRYGLSLSQVANAIKQNNLNRPGGLIKGERDELRIRTIGRKYTDQELSSIVVSNKNERITLDEVAVINDGLEEDRIITTVNGRSAIIARISKTKNEDTIRIAKSVHQYLSSIEGTLPRGVEIGILFDNSDSIRYQIDILIENGITGLIVVFFILWLFLNARLSFWTGMGILISVVGSITLIWALDGTFNMVSILGFILILGIVADDAIVVGESIAWHRRQGKSSFQAAIDGFEEVGLPVVLAVLTTIIAFIPLMYIDSMLGRFIRILPMVVISCLVVSLFECFAILPAHLSHLPGPEQKEGRKSLFYRLINFLPEMMEQLMTFIVDKVYSPLLSRILQLRYLFLCFTITLLMLSVGLMQGNLLKFEMLPERDGFYLASIIEFPEGTPIKITEKTVKDIEEAIIRVAQRSDTISGEPLIKNIMAISGQAPDTEPGEMGPVGSHFGGVQVTLLDAKSRGIHTSELAQLWKKELGPVYGVKSLRFTGTVMGSADKPIDIAILGYDMNKISQAVALLKEKLSEYEGVFDIESDDIYGRDEMQFRLKPEAETLGITLQNMADQLFNGYHGKEVLRVQRDNEEVKINVRYSKQERHDLDSLDHFMIRNSQGMEVPLSVIAAVTIVPGSASIARIEGMRRVSVAADIDPAVILEDDVIDELSQGFLQEMKIKFPELKISLEGEAEERRASLQTMFFGFFVAILSIYIIIASLFRSYLQPLIILVTVPFGIIGSIWGHYTLGWNLTMISLFGMVGLTGIVINDAIVLIERINKYIREGTPIKEAVRQGGVRRFRAVMLTSITTIGGMTPLIIENDSYATTLIPMAITIVFGIAFATVLTLFLIPSLFLILNDLRCLIHRQKFVPGQELTALDPINNESITTSK